MVATDAPFSVSSGGSTRSAAHALDQRPQGSGDGRSTGTAAATADGGLDLPLSVSYSLCTDTWRAQRLAKIALERVRQGLQVELNCNLRAYDLAPGS